MDRSSVLAVVRKSSASVFVYGFARVVSVILRQGLEQIRWLELSNLRSDLDLL